MSRTPNLPTFYELTHAGEILDSIYEIAVEEFYRFVNKDALTQEGFDQIAELIKVIGSQEKFVDNNKHQLRDSIVMLMTMSQISLAEQMLAKADPSLFERTDLSIDKMVPSAIKEVAARKYFMFNNYQFVVPEDEILETVESLIALVGNPLELIENRHNNLYESIMLFVQMEMIDCAQLVIDNLNLVSLDDKNWQKMQQEYGDILDFTQKSRFIADKADVINTSEDDVKQISLEISDRPDAKDLYHLVSNVESKAKDLSTMLHKIESSGLVLKEDSQLHLCYTLASLANMGEFSFMKKIVDNSDIDSIVQIDQRMIERVVAKSLNKSLLNIYNIVLDAKSSGLKDNTAQELSEKLTKISDSGAFFKEDEQFHLRDTIRMLVDMGMTNYVDDILDNANLHSIGIQNRHLMRNATHNTFSSKYIPSLSNIYEMVCLRLSKYPGKGLNESKDDFGNNFAEILNRLSFADITLEENADLYLQATITNLLYMGESELTAELMSYCEPSFFEVGAMKQIKNNLHGAKLFQNTIKAEENLKKHSNVNEKQDVLHEGIVGVLRNLKDSLSIGEDVSAKKDVTKLKNLGCDQYVVLKTVIENRGPHGEFDVATDVLSFMLEKGGFYAGTRKIGNEYEEVVDDVFRLAVTQYLQAGENKETDYELAITLLKTQKVLGLEETAKILDYNKNYDLEDLLVQRDGAIQERKNYLIMREDNLEIRNMPDTTIELHQRGGDEKFAENGQLLKRSNALDLSI